MQLIQYLIDFSISAGLLIVLWMLFLQGNHYLIKQKNAVLQEAAGSILALAVLVAFGVILGTYGLGLSVGIFFIVIFISVKRMLKKVYQQHIAA